MSQIKCTDLSLGYNGKLIAEGIDFLVQEGDYLCIVGENGAGKSTLVKTLLGIEKPQGGKISFDKKLCPTKIGYLPQQPETKKDFPATVEEIVMSGTINNCKRRFWFSKSEKKRMESSLKKLGIYNLKKESYATLSGGQKQRVLIARAMCAAEKLLLLDEPAAGLDPVATNEMYHMMMDLNVADNITIIMVSHDINAAVRHAKHILHLGDGQVFFGTVDEYRQSKIGKEFLGNGKCGRCDL